VKILLVALSALILGDGAAQARTFTVPCSGTTGDVASLVTDIGTANSVGGSNTIVLGAGCIYTLTGVDNNWYGPNGLPVIASNLTIEGNGSTIARAASAAKFRLLVVGADPASPSTINYSSPGAGNLTVRDVTLSDGFAQGGDSNGGGGGAGMGGAIFNQGTVTIINSTLTANKAHGGSAIDPLAGGGGGGIGTSSAGINGGGFGAGSFGGALGGSGYMFTASGGAGFGTSDNGAAATAGSPGAGGGPMTGLGGDGGTWDHPGGSAGDGSGGGGSGHSFLGTSAADSGDGRGGDFGAGGAGTYLTGGYDNFVGGGGGGVGGGGGEGASTTGGGGGFGGGGGAGHGSGGTLQQPAGGGTGGFGGGGGGVTASGPGATAGASGFGGGYGSSASGGGGAGMGGAVFNMQGTLVITNSTLASNSAIGGTDNVPDHGKGIAGAVFNLSGTFTASDSTFARNTASTSASQIYNLVYDGHQARTAQVTLVDTIVANGLGSADLATAKSNYITPANLGSADVNVSQFDLVGTLVDEQLSTITGSPLTADPLLGPLQDNGGPTQTMALMTGSPAIDAGSSAGLTTDQRGDPRPFDFSGIPNGAGDGSDIGAFEVQGACPSAATPTEACHRLSVSLAGAGTGTVGGTAITCPGACSGNFGASSIQLLSATPSAGSTFIGWSGACTGGGVCQLAMNTDQAVTATFAAAGGTTTTPGSGGTTTTPGSGGTTTTPGSGGTTTTPGSGGTTTTPGSEPPSITDVKQSAAAWRAGTGLPHVARKKKPPIGTVFTFNLNEAAAVTLTFTHRVGGRRVRATCVAPTAKNTGKPRCTRTNVVGTMMLAGHQGADAVSFQGRLSARKKLASGSYTVTILATDAAGRSSAPRSLSFAIVK
jgi:hypothetical protein